jgi:hypothetical protein
MTSEVVRVSVGDGCIENIRAARVVTSIICKAPARLSEFPPKETNCLLAAIFLIYIRFKMGTSRGANIFIKMQSGSTIAINHSNRTIMKLTLGVGVDNLVFGMKRAAVERILGMPDEIFIDEDDTNQLIWVFNKKKMMLTFYKDENYKLGYLRTSNPQLKYNETKIIGMDVEHAKQAVFRIKRDSWKVEDYSFFSIHTNYKNRLVLNVAYGMITDVEIGLRVDERKRYIWPCLEDHKSSIKAV